MGTVLRAACAPAAVFVAAVIAARTPYGPRLYPLLHFLGGAAMALFFSEAARIAARRLGELRPAARLLLSFSMACTVAVLWEIGEFAWDRAAGTRLQEGLEDTMMDLIYGVCGAAAFAVAAALLARRRRNG